MIRFASRPSFVSRPLVVAGGLRVLVALALVGAFAACSSDPEGPGPWMDTETADVADGASGDATPADAGDAAEDPAPDAGPDADATEQDVTDVEGDAASGDVADSAGDAAADADEDVAPDDDDADTVSDAEPMADADAMPSDDAAPDGIDDPGVQDAADDPAPADAADTADAGPSWPVLDELEFNEGSGQFGAPSIELVGLRGETPLHFLQGDEGPWEDGAQGLTHLSLRWESPVGAFPELGAEDITPIRSTYRIYNEAGEEIAMASRRGAFRAVDGRWVSEYMFVIYVFGRPTGLDDDLMLATVEITGARAEPIRGAVWLRSSCCMRPF